MTTHEELVKAVVAASRIEGDRKYLTCEQAFELAGTFDVKVADIGAICNDENVKIKDCQLGCF